MVETGHFALALALVQSPGDSDEDVPDYIVSRYGEFVLPRFSLRNGLLWGAPALLLLCGAFVMFLAGRSRKRTETATLSAPENAALDEILRREQ